MLLPREAEEELLRVAVLVLRDTVLLRLLVTVERDELPLMPRTVDVVPRVVVPERTAPRSPRVPTVAARLLARALVPVRPFLVTVRVDALAPRPEPPVIAYPRPPLKPRRGVLLAQLWPYQPP